MDFSTACGEPGQDVHYNSQEGKQSFEYISVLFIFCPQDGSVHFPFNVKLAWDPNFL